MTFFSPGLYELIVAVIVGGIVYYLGTIIPNPIVQRLFAVVAIIIALLGLLAFLRTFVS